MSTVSVFLKGNLDSPFMVTEVDKISYEQGSNGEIISILDSKGIVIALFPLNAVAAITQADSPVFATYPIEQTPNGGWIRNVREDGQGSWVPYTGPIYGVKE